jgi:putative membrane protein
MMTTALVATEHHDGWGPWGDDGPPAYWPVFPLLWLCLVAAAIVRAVVLVRRSRAAEPRRAGERHLAERYAAGEIDEQEYRARRDVLRERPTE